CWATCGWSRVASTRPCVRRSRRCPPIRPTRVPTGRWPRSRAPAATSRRPAATWKPSHGWPRAATTPGACARSWPPRARPESARLELDPGAVVDEQDHVAVVELHHGHRALEAVDVDGAGGAERLARLGRGLGDQPEQLRSEPLRIVHAERGRAEDHLRSIG